ncbi:MAG: CusA/CzcA family heavy metal efflux RND transporter [Zetaproteobacteria bacterium CG06_land_8_20_14_3_00_59_53]|nr:MAG: cation transporter [Zetaproteobacteria bacterium CG2_30_59_37]PIO90005.1 MAG: CusA/CzcA family heavy metal efflux RND transporter [Zetaproteobacteria bacterium CG23_combo_of_CG06-09_8_20_14_all_59_86]PIQ65023.1 MAG: CusA/CzcA family heavy metal efflux RND transporter [Zetaproteobacteria bacterium CG11_big_fil_rev_8_21_14_0_20_59_439]PIU69407.1 MAG: CusA/CzcA family heavy metal efflux RND transporter [Zetaproteobacteria bacterium CG06_land_8_20_14_3_00_59_53]PIU96841.1 MAG: CusA/CzcA fam
MIANIIDASLRNRFMVLLASGLIVAAGLFAVKHIPLDAVPDLSDVQVIVFTQYDGQSPQVVEDQVTYPLTTAMLAVPHAKVVRGYSFFGFSFVYIIFDDGTDMYWARSRVLEYLNYVAGRLPAGVTPTLGPDATGVGWIYEYALVDRTGRHDLAELRSIQDWYLRYALQTVNGVSEVASIGGFVKQYQVEVDPNTLAGFGIPLARVKEAIRRSNNDVGGSVIEMGETEFMVRGKGYLKGIGDLESIPIGVDAHGTPILMRDVAHVHLGPELRRGVVELNGEGEVAGGVIIMRYGQNALTTIRAVRQKLAELKPGLPEGVEIVPTYDRGQLIERAVGNLKQTLLEESIIVALVCLLFLMHARSALVAIVSLLAGILLAFVIMQWQGLSANIMSLGGIAIAIGAMIDGAIVMIENAHKHLEFALSNKQALNDKRAGNAEAQLSAGERLDAVGRACREVGPALFFSLLIITVSFLPVFTLQAQEGRLFSPLAFTKTYAMAAASLLAVTLVPVLMGLFIRGRIPDEQRNPLNRLLQGMHTPLLDLALRARGLTIALALVLLGASIYPVMKTGTEFMPPLDEGDILYMPTTFPGISITKARELVQQTDIILKTFSEVESVFGKVGRADTATDPAPLSMLETIVRLKPKSEWPDPHKSTQELMHEMDQAIRFPGLANAWTYPIKTRIDMLSTGIKTPVGIKVSGPDLNVLQEVGVAIERAINKLPDTMSAFSDRAAGGYYLDIDIQRDNAARYGLTVGDIEDVISSAIGGMNVTQTVEGLERYPVNLRYPRDYRSDPEALKRVLIPTLTGAQIPIAAVAEIHTMRGPPSIKSENARPNAWVYVDMKSGDIGGYVERAKQMIADEVKIPNGYAIEWSGQYEYMQRAAARMQIVIPATLLLIFLLLYFNFGNIMAPLVVMLSVPFALIGGFWLVWLLGFNLSVAVAVGFIALAGVAAEIGVLVLTFIDQEVSRRRDQAGGRLSQECLKEAVRSGVARRVRPIAMTATAVIAGLFPIMLGNGTGSDVMQRISAPMIGGMLSTTILCLIVLPAIYSQLLQWQEARKR